MSTRLPFVLLPALLACGPALAASEEAKLPQSAPPYSAVYKVTTRARDKAQDPWSDPVEDTVTIAVSAAKVSRWDYKSDGHTILNDKPARATTVFGGKTPPNVAYRSVTAYVPIGWEFGYETVRKVNDTPAKVLGKKTIAGKECTQIQLTSEQYGEPEYCVTASGIVLAFANASATAQIAYEAQSLNEAPPDDKLFSVPAGTTVQERGGLRVPQIPRTPPAR